MMMMKEMQKDQSQRRREGRKRKGSAQDQSSRAREVKKLMDPCHSLDSLGSRKVDMNQEHTIDSFSFALVYGFLYFLHHSATQDSDITLVYVK